MWVNVRSYTYENKGVLVTSTFARRAYMTKVEINGITLSIKELAFCELLAKGEKNWVAAQKIFPAPNTENGKINSQTKDAYGARASRLLKRENVKRYMEYVGKEASKRAILGKNRILEELSEIANAEVKIRGTDKIKALKVLMEYHEKKEEAEQQQAKENAPRKSVMERLEEYSREIEEEKNAEKKRRIQQGKDCPSCGTPHRLPEDFEAINRLEA